MICREKHGHVPYVHLAKNISRYITILAGEPALVFLGPHHFFPRQVWNTTIVGLAIFRGPPEHTKESHALRDQYTRYRGREVTISNTFQY
jgi:hypothetical protein